MDVEEPILKPGAGNDMTRSEFVDLLRNLLDDLEDDHEGSTGITETETHSWDFWIGEVTNAYVNR